MAKMGLGNYSPQYLMIKLLNVVVINQIDVSVCTF